MGSLRVDAEVQKFPPLMLTEDNQHEAMRNHGVSFFDAKNTASFMERNKQI